MDFVGNDDDSVPLTDIGQPRQGFAVPKEADGVVRIAQDEGLRPVVDQALQALEVHVVPPVLEKEGIVHGHAPQPLDIQPEVVVYGRLDDDLVARFRKSEIGLVDGGDDSGRIGDPVPLRDEPMDLLLPEGDGVDKSLGRGGVPQRVPIQAPAESFRHIRVRPEVHVRDPHRDFPVGGPAPFDAEGAAAVDDLVEVPTVGDPARLAARQHRPDRSGREERRSRGGRHALEKCPAFHSRRQSYEKRRIILIFGEINPDS